MHGFGLSMHDWSWVQGWCHVRHGVEHLDPSVSRVPRSRAGRRGLFHPTCSWPHALYKKFQMKSCLRLYIVMVLVLVVRASPRPFHAPLPHFLRPSPSPLCSLSSPSPFAPLILSLILPSSSQLVPRLPCFLLSLTSHFTQHPHCLPSLP